MKHRLSYLILVLTLLAAMLNTSPVYAANAVVGNGTAASCTEAAFDSALAIATIGGGTITFNCGPAIKTITFTSSKSILSGNVTINGNNLIILSGGPGVRHFFINDGLTFTLQNITLRDGDSPVGGGAIEASGAYIVLESVKLLNNYASNQGGAIYCYIGVDGTLTVNNSFFENNASANGGAIYNDGCTTTISNTTFLTNDATASGGALHNAFNASLIVNGSTFQSNTALDGGGLFNNSGATATLNFVTFQGNTGGYGGGLENSGAITINDSLFNLNVVTGSGGGIWNLGGTVTLNRTTISNNSAYEGGGINTYGADLQITKANIVDNIATGTHGGGIYHGGGTAFITDATISGNQANAATANGGGIYQNSDDNLTLTNVTLADNQAGMLGGGFYHFGRYAILTNVTIANNLAGVAGDAIYEDSPMTPLNPGIVQIGNSVILGSANNCDGGMFQSFGYNLSQGTCASLVHATDQDNYVGSLNLSPLASNGGVYPMQTMMPTAGSPLIDAGDNTICPSTDQRGQARPLDGDGNGSALCDIGAVEFIPAPIFADVPMSYWSVSWVERLYSAGITGGCANSPLRYCPENIVTRAQMAVFLEKSLHGPSFVPANVTPTFGDITGHWAEDWIEALKADGITGGCGSGNYCPDAPVTRAQMAIFLLRSKHGVAYNPPSATGSVFGDVPAGYWAADWIERLATEGITAGCGSGNYCPENPVTRAQMAVFLVKTFGLP